MIVFLDEDRAYLNWVTHHRAGFVLDCLRHPTKAHLVLHRATCPRIKHAESKHTHWTTGRHLKACSLGSDELRVWAEDQSGHQPANCEHCLPQREVEAETHLTRLDRDILEVVLEVASIHIDENDGAYSLTVGTVARCLGKSEGQLAPSLARLVVDEMLLMPGHQKPSEIPSPRRALVPTAKALRMLPDFADLTASELDAELGKLARGG